MSDEEIGTSDISPLTDEFFSTAKLRLPNSSNITVAVETASSNKPKTGVELVAYWKTVGVIDSRSDIMDSQKYARKLRYEAETNGNKWNQHQLNNQQSFAQRED